MLLFKDRPIKQKFLLIIMTVNLTTLLLLFSTFMVYDRLQVQGTILDQTATIADILAFNCTAALMFDDSTDARETLSFLKTKPGILAAWIFTAKGLPLSHYVRKGFEEAKTPPPVQKSSYVIKNKILYLYREVRLESKAIGTVLVQSDMRQMTGLAENHLLIAVAVLLFSLLVSLLLSIRLQKSIANPIVELAALSRKVSKENDYAVRASKHGDDELGYLVDAFNEMLLAPR